MAKAASVPIEVTASDYTDLKKAGLKFSDGWGDQEAGAMKGMAPTKEADKEGHEDLLKDAQKPKKAKLKED